MLTNLPTIIESERKRLDAPYSIEELEFAIKASKLNKAPGSDGYSIDFLKN